MMPVPCVEKPNAKRTGNTGSKVIDDKKLARGGLALRCYHINEVMTRVCLARPNIAKKLSDVKMMKMSGVLKFGTVTDTLSIYLAKKFQHNVVFGVRCPSPLARMQN